MRDVGSTVAFFSLFLSKDWDIEYLRSRLTEIYDKEFVDQLLPFQKEHYFDLGRMETIQDEDLEKFGFHEPENADNLYTFDEPLYHTRQKTKEKIDVEANFPKKKYFFDSLMPDWNTLGSNCWAVHGKFTKSGKPILQCDPHLGKLTTSVWYPTRLAWNEKSPKDGSSYRTYIAGHSVIGAPYFSHIRTPFVAGGMTALNPDAKDLFLEEVTDDKYLASDGTWKDVGVIHEVIKVRFGSDVHFDVKYTDNGVLLPRDIFHKDTRPFHEFIVQELWESDEQLWDQGKMYALAQFYDPLVHEHLGTGKHFH